MFLLAILHLATLVIATEYGTFGQAVSHSVHTNRELLNKPNNLIYNYEQARKDQHPQIEQRDESISMYMNRPKFTTTTPVPYLLQSFPKFSEVLPKGHFPGLHKSYESQPWNYVSAFPSTIPPPPMPKWSDLSVDFNKQTSSRYHTHELNSLTAPLQTPINHLNTYPNNPQQTYQSSWSDQNKNDNRKIDIPKQPAEFLHSNTAVELTTTTTFNPINKFVNYQEERQNSVIPQFANSRGSHKFNWNDVASDSYQVTTAPVASVNTRPPLAIPTLSSWHDGFGK
ncbi:hypothetical protein K1T71_004522 [Dendrolimus kikuchii]|uniref:Uncharacterized protein n=1 Tax=Dendrolimus kikuchii TaxID=765133 RepID=A0ACC1D7X2_9NEOP|nr:hypothetical protein K1T71_004522 [Dendrolimus kikuchii]